MTASEGQHAVLAPALAERSVDTESRSRRAYNRWLRIAAIEVLPPLVAAALATLGWWLYVEIDNTPGYFLPSPVAVFEELVNRPGYYVEEGWFTLKNGLAGLAIGTTVAILLATVMAHSRLVEKSVFPLAILIKVTPVLAIAPLFTVWWGFGVAPKIAVAALISWFPMLVAGMVGFRSVEPATLDFMRSIRASPWAIFAKLRLPSSLPYLIAGMRVALPLSLIGAVIAEWSGSAHGLGRLIFISNSNLNLEPLFAAIVVLAILGVALNVVLSVLERTLLGWHTSQQQ